MTPILPILNSLKFHQSHLEEEVDDKRKEYKVRVMQFFHDLLISCIAFLS